MSTNTPTWTPLCVEGAYMGTDARFGDHRGYFQELFHKAGAARSKHNLT